MYTQCRSSGIERCLKLYIGTDFRGSSEIYRMNRMHVRKCADHTVYVQEMFVNGILCTYMLLVLLVMLINCDVYRGQAVRDLSECL